MLTTQRQKSLAMMICLAGLAAGCSGGGAGPTEPEPARSRLTLDFASITAIEHCDGLFEGDGDFEFKVWIVRPDEYRLHMFNSMEALGPGGKTKRLGSFSFNAVDGDIVTVHFEASEWDHDIFGNVYHDSRLSSAKGTRSHRFRDGTWTSLGYNSLLLGSEGCRVRLDWTASFATVQM